MMRLRVKCQDEDGGADGDTNEGQVREESFYRKVLNKCRGRGRVLGSLLTLRLLTR